jgi:hypothetical protein
VAMATPVLCLASRMASRAFLDSRFVSLAIQIRTWVSRRNHLHTQSSSGVPGPTMSPTIFTLPDM